MGLREAQLVPKPHPQLAQKNQQIIVERPLFPVYSLVKYDVLSMILFAHGEMIEGYRHARVVFTRKVGLALPRILSVENCTGVLLLARVVVCSIFTHATPNLIRTTSHLAGVTENWRETRAVRHMMTLDTPCITSTYYIHAACIRIVDARFLSKRSNPAQQWDSVIPTSSSFLLSRPSPTCDLGPAEGDGPSRPFQSGAGYLTLIATSHRSERSLAGASSGPP